MIKVPAKSLIESNEYIIDRLQKFRTVKKVIDLGTGNNIPEADKGKLLIVHDDCSQRVLDPEQMVSIKEV